jgi:hypothetical protein
VSGARTLELPRWPLASLASAARADAGITARKSSIYRPPCRQSAVIRLEDRSLGSGKEW